MFENRFSFPPLQPGDRVRIVEGTFEGFEGILESLDPESDKVTVAIEVFGRETPIEVERWQVERLPPE